ncbi:MAG: 30S ribosomal protein S2, partial [Candidatus Omnitrophota bacterium]|nr:30S ribosomal protein S2 [Candidatus Omnitrophota bacterium]
TKEMDKLKKNLQGVVNMTKMPGAMYVVDAKKELIAIKEAIKLSIPIVAIVDTNVDPDLIDHPIPANDDAMRSIKLITSIVTDAVLEGKQQFEQTTIDRKREKAKEEAESSAAEEEASTTAAVDPDESAAEIKLAKKEAKKERKQTTTAKKKGKGPGRPAASKG